MGLTDAYSRIMQKYPAVVQILTGSLLGSLSDVVAQLIVGDAYDPIRTFRFFMNGLLVMMPITKIWFTILDIIVPHGTSKRPIKLLLVDQLIGSPIITLIMFTAIGLLRGDSFAAVQQFISEFYFTALLNSYMVWPLAQLINFSLVPEQYRMLFMNVIAFFFGILMAMTLEPRKTKDEL